MKTTAFTKTYNKRVVLDLPELMLPEGKITAVIGPNGSGKSTFAKILGGIDRPDAPHPVLPEISAGYLPQKSFPFRMKSSVLFVKSFPQHNAIPYYHRAYQRIWIRPSFTTARKLYRPVHKKIAVIRKTNIFVITHCLQLQARTKQNLLYMDHPAKPALILP